MRRLFQRRVLPVLLLLLALSASANPVSAHAVPLRANPPIDGVVPAVPTTIEIWFSEEISSNGTTVAVIGPDGARVDTNDAAVDLTDINRQRVTVSLRASAIGTYIVQWHSVSGIDDDGVDGSFRFRVDPNATPQIIPSPTEMPVLSTQAPTAEQTPTPPTAEPYDFDERAVGLSVGVGLVFVVLIFLFWRMVRPRPTKS